MSGPRVVIRVVAPSDASAVRELTARAFAGAEHASPAVEEDGVPGEATLVGWLRESPSGDERFDVVAQIGHEIVGHAIATWGDLDGVPVLGIGPVSVTPRWQGCGVGEALMRELLARAQELGESVVVLLGEPSYYARLGFVPASRVGITADPAWGDYFQACVLLSNPREAVPQGIYKYAEPFARLAELA